MSDVSISPGAKGSAAHQVEERHCTLRGEYRIFSTPNMVQLLERAAIDALNPFLTDKQISVGTRIDVKHLAPTPEGGNVRAEAEVQEVDGARVVFGVEIFDDLEKVGEAVHDRYVLDFDRYVRRLEKKIAAGKDNEV